MSDRADLLQILYISTVSSTETVDLEAILAAARRNNRVRGITGLLMFNGKRFLQVLEGPGEAVEETFARIRRDTRHRAHVMLSRKAVEKREFGDWSMAFREGCQGGETDIYDVICAKSAAAHPNLRAELTSFARQI
jgi:hypothetical protein